MCLAPAEISDHQELESWTVLYCNDMGSGNWTQVLCQNSKCHLPSPRNIFKLLFITIVGVHVHDVCMMCAHDGCTWYVCMMCVHEVCTWCVYDMCTWCVCMMCVYDVYAWCVHMMCVHNMCTWCMYDVCAWCMHTHMCCAVLCCTCSGQRTTFRSWSSPSTFPWMLGMEAGPSGKSLTYWPISAALFYVEPVSF